MPDGVFLSCDGLDGTGKSTQCRLLAERLRKLGVTVTSCIDPGSTDIGQRLREILLHGRQTRICMRTEALLFMASRAQLVDEVIEPALERGEVIISDRYLLANVVYQGHAGGIDPRLLWTAGSLSTGGLEPHLTLVLDLPVEQAASRRRGEEDRVEGRGAVYLEKVRQGFLTEARQKPVTCKVIDASAGIDQVEERIWQAVRKLLTDRGHLNHSSEPKQP
jgi:dTMP kinase